MPEMQFHVKNFLDLFDFTSFFAWTFFLIFWPAVREIRLRDRINILHPLPQYHIKYVGHIFTGYEFYYFFFSSG